MMEMWEHWKAEWASWEASGHRAAAGAADPGPHPNFLVAVPTEQLRDVDWPNEVKKWYGTEGEEMWIACVQAVCYISLHKVRGGYYDLVVLDEAHHITMLSSQFFRANVALAVMGLTATQPDPKLEPDKYLMLKEIAPVIFSYPLEQGVEEGVVADFEINVILSVLDDHKKIIPAGSKAKPFMQTEKAAYEYQEKRIKGMRIQANSGVGDAARIAKALKFMELARYRFMCNLPSKLRIAQAVIAKEYGEPLLAAVEHVQPQHVRRTLVFAGSIEQCGALCGSSVYHSKSGREALDKFIAKEISLLGCVKALDEGVNIKDLDQGIITQVDSNPRTVVQRVGRIVRYREGHKGRIFILCVQNTVDESWLKSALAGFDEKRIKYLTAKSYVP